MKQSNPKTQSTIKSIQKLRKSKRIFAWALMLSIVVFSLTFVLSQNKSYETINAPIEDETVQPVVYQDSSGGLLITASLATSLVSLIGFLSTTILAWKKERREVVLAQLEIRKQELELEKLRAETKGNER